MRLPSKTSVLFNFCVLYARGLREFIGPQGPISDAELDLKMTKAITRPDMHTAELNRAIQVYEALSRILPFELSRLMRRRNLIRSM